MNEPLQFKMRVERGADSQVTRVWVEEDGYHRAEFKSDPMAKVTHRFLTHEHRNGRVAQGTCSEGKACDRERIHVPLRDFNQEARAILCPKCEADLAAARA